MAELVAKRYAQALFEVAYEENKHKEIEEELLALINIFETNPSFFELLKTPLITVEEKKQVLTEVIGGRVSTELFNFLNILLDKGREGFIFHISRHFKLLSDKVENITEAIAITAIPMNQDDLTRLEQKLSVVSKKKVKLVNEVDSSVIGGILIKIGDKVIDGSIRNRLWNIKQQLTEMII
ncbi:F0F1 ATP synthase subunit delta [Serpentinicella alkaliphila]|uniref:ATP synthase subunit delta n=1 Tax=Serpentinicella alkaliphila TaxID=1734049 RepID=A0A4R2THS5_9FIRM|nr:F0F1 ATP synthase subunit delta [Serpentinicella alkaliphila]QUH24957.1 F0F1 ATP synthase subunit delta [Serpentinicella alkaliphila]TCQ02761.1 ATP synthase F1 subcomplex delta subunit [Serpentinicella alkaliphila]